MILLLKLILVKVYESTVTFDTAVAIEEVILISSINLNSNQDYLTS